MEIQWKIPDNTYLDYLRENYERRIPFSDYGDDKYKPFFGSLFEVKDMIYISQVSHPQDRHLKLKQNIDFYKIYHPDDGRLISVINLNYMFPIHKSFLINLEYKDIDKYRTFKDKEAKSKYIDLLNIELKSINGLPIIDSAKNIYENKYKYPDSKVSQRCFDFKLLEKACLKYQQTVETIKEIAQQEPISTREQVASSDENKLNNI